MTILKRVAAVNHAGHRADMLATLSWWTKRWKKRWNQQRKGKERRKESTGKVRGDRKRWILKGFHSHTTSPEKSHISLRTCTLSLAVLELTFTACLLLLWLFSPSRCDGQPAQRCCLRGRRAGKARRHPDKPFTKMSGWGSDFWIMNGSLSPGWGRKGLSGGSDSSGSHKCILIDYLFKGKQEI